MRGPQTVL
uniref:Uncharacterized protein n=1 Tax=Anguilla anguilla TaxID=7936 RepID=A0A0E9VYD3_ANGAN